MQQRNSPGADMEYQETTILARNADLQAFWIGDTKFNKRGKLLNYFVQIASNP